VSVFDKLRGRAPKQPGFGIVGTADPAAPAPRTIIPADYGLPPRTEIRSDLGGPDPLAEQATDAAKRGDWQTASSVLRGCGTDWERRSSLVTRLGGVAKDDDSWLAAWLAAEPNDAGAHTVYANSLVLVAWAIRTGSRAENVTSEQWNGFFRVLNQAPEHCLWAAAQAPGDPTPWIEMLTVARGLQFDNDQFREVWREVVTRDPNHLGAHLMARGYWLPRWYGSTELHDQFVEDATRGRPNGSLFTLVRLRGMFDEQEPSNAAEREEFYRDPQPHRILDEAVADLAAARPDHPYLASQRHMLAYFFTNAGRFAEAYEQFKAIGAYCGASPWSLYNDPVGQFVGKRATAVMGWEDAGRPALP